MPKVSVITGFYNRAPLLERTIESILNQSFTDFELIVFDDASTDGTGERLKQLAAKYADPRFTYLVHEKNTGFVQGLADAVARSKGEYIAIQGSGDASLPNRLALQSALLDERPEVGVVGGWYYNVQEDLGTHRLRQPDANDLTFERLLLKNAFSHGEVMIRRSVYDEVGGYRIEFVNSQDYDLWLRVAKVARFATVPEPIYERYVQFDGVSYVPRKIVQQSCYSVSARRIAKMGPEETAAALALIRHNGPTALVPPSDPAVQKKVQQAVLRLVFFGSPESAMTLAKANIHNPVKKVALVGFAAVYGSRIFRPIRPILARPLGITRPETA